MEFNPLGDIKMLCERQTWNADNYYCTDTSFGIVSHTRIVCLLLSIISALSVRNHHWHVWRKFELWRFLSELKSYRTICTSRIRSIIRIAQMQPDGAKRYVVLDFHIHVLSYDLRTLSLAFALYLLVGYSFYDDDETTHAFSTRYKNSTHQKPSRSGSREYGWNYVRR